MTKEDAPKDGKKWFVTAYDYGDGELLDPEEEIWTISQDPNKTGWSNDGNCRGYGLTKAIAEEISTAANAWDSPELLRERIKELEKNK